METIELDRYELAQIRNFNGFYAELIYLFDFSLEKN